MSLAELIQIPQDRVQDLILALKKAHRTVALSESLTAGLACAVLTEIPGASAVVRGGFIVYATDLKNTLGGVDADLLASRGAVDPDVATELALGARKRCRADYGLGLTGAAGPNPQDGNEPGTVYVALASPGPADTVTTSVRHLKVSGTRSQVRAAAVRAALELLEEATAVLQ